MCEKTCWMLSGGRESTYANSPILRNGQRVHLTHRSPDNVTAARVVTLSRKSCHITPILKELHWLPVSQRIVFKLMLIVHKSFNNIAPIYIFELLKVYTPSRNLRSSNMSLLKEPTSKTGVIDLFLSQLRDSGIIFQLNSNLVIVKPDLSRCLKLILCHNFSKMMYICNCIVHVSRHIMLFLLSL